MKSSKVSSQGVTPVTAKCAVGIESTFRAGLRSECNECVVPVKSDSSFRDRRLVLTIDFFLEGFTQLLGHHTLFLFRSVVKGYYVFTQVLEMGLTRGHILVVGWVVLPCVSPVCPIYMSCVYKSLMRNERNMVALRIYTAPGNLRCPVSVFVCSRVSRCW